MNIVVLMGNLGSNPTLRETKSGQPVLNFSMCVDDFYYRTDDSGVKVKEKRSDWFPVVVFGQTAKSLHKYLQTGSKVAVEGSLRTRTWEDESGRQNKVFEIIAEKVSFVDKIKAQETKTA